MGYWPYPKLIHDNRALLEAILQAVEQSQELPLKVDHKGVNQYHFHVSRVLKAAEIFPQELNGKFAALRKQVSVHQGPGIVTIKPRRGVTQPKLAEPWLVQLEAYTGRFINLTFPGTIAEDELISRCAALGWRLVPESRTPTLGTGVEYALVREETSQKPKPSEDILAKLGFRPH